MDTNKPKFLVESCLLTFGLKSVDNAALLESWRAAGLGGVNIAWVEAGEVRFGGIEDYLSFRAAAPRGKFSSERLDRAAAEKSSGALTASGTMEVCRRLGIPCAVSCGLGGIGEVKGEELCPDLPALRDTGVVLIGTSPKDMLDRAATMEWLAENGVKVVGDGTDECTGYVFNGEPVKLAGELKPGAEPAKAPLLILRGIPAEKRIKDAPILKQAVADAKEAEAHGGYYHPAANASLDRQTDGYSSRIQLDSLLDNIKFAERLAEEKKI